MRREVKLTHLNETLEELTYPVAKADAVDDLAEVTLRYADGEERLAAVVERSNADEFASAEELESEVYSNLPTEAVGEPGQSEGEG